MIKGIIFDLGGVLFTSGSKKFIEYLSKRYDFDPQKALNLISDGELGTAYREGKITRGEFWEKLTKELQLTEDIDALEDEWISHYKPIQGTKEIVGQLAKKYPVFFLSDNVRERVEKLDKKHNFLTWFKDGIFSHEVGVRKPHPKIYKIALKKLRVKPKEAIFIDDKAKNLIPAQDMGMQTILFENPEKLKKDLIKLGVIN